MRTFRFLDFKVYQDAKFFCKNIFELTKHFPKEFYELSDQLRRAALSICLNIAEGSAKKTDKDFAKFLSNSLGSASECVSALDLVLEFKLISQVIFDKYEKDAESIANQLGGFVKKLRS